MSRVSMLAAVVVLAAGCRAKQQPVPPRQGPPQFDEPPSKTDDGAVSEPSTVTPAAPQGCTDAGRPWDGKLEGCLYEVGGCCFDDAASACAAARCPQECQVFETSPAQVRCVVTP